MKSPPRKLLLPFLIAFIGIGTPYLIEALGWDRPDPEAEVDRFEVALEERTERLEKELKVLSDRDSQRTSWEVSGAKEANGLYYLTYKGDSLLHWSSNEVPDPDDLRKKIRQGPLVKGSNAWYYGKVLKKGGTDHLGLAMIKKDHGFENRYLKEGFFEGSGLPASARIEPDTSEQGKHLFGVSLREKESLFRIAYPAEKKISELAFWSSVLLNLLGIFSFLIFLFRLEGRLSQRFPPAMAVSGIILLLLLLREFTLMNQFPGIWQRSHLFSPTLYAASDRFPTLGDLMINAVLFLFMAFLVQQRCKLYRFPAAPTRALIWVLPSSLLIVAFGLWSVELIRGAVENSNIFFDLNQPFQLSVYSLIGLLAVGLLLFSYYLLADLLLILTGGKGRQILFALGSTALGVAIIAPLMGIDRVRALLPVALILSMSWVHYRRGGRYAFPQAIGILAVFAFFTASVFAFYSSYKEKQNRELLAEQLADDEDPVTDLRFDELEDELARDSTLIKALNGKRSPNEVLNELERSYFRGYWNEYRINGHLFDANGDFVLRLNDNSSRSKRELERLMKELGSPTELSDHLYYVHRSPDLVNYVARIPVGQGRLYVELMSRQVPRELGFPALFLHEQDDMMRDLRNYSYARFLEGRLVDRSGSYPYRRNLDAYEGLKGERSWLEEGGQQHLFYRTGKGNAIVLSQPAKGFLAKATTFSYLFIFFSILLLCFVAIKDLSKGLGEWQLSLKGKVRVLMVGITLASVLIFALVTRSYVSEQYRSKNERQILEKTRSLLLELDSRLGQYQQLRPSLKGYADYTLSELSNVFFTDINLYGPRGRLFMSSREKVFKEGLLGRYMHPSAYKALRKKKKSEFVQKEQIGRMDYLSAYMPLSTGSGELLGYLNLPYFAKQNELEQELSAFFVAILNIFVLLLALSLVAALFVSNWVLGPLRRLQESLSRIELRASNDPLEYRGNDEIGGLVEEYNRKVAELEEKADALARTERESAWREMAKQVAHEIKNPLTPMRLQLQQLKRSGQGMDPEALSKTADGLIERIDTLSRIAGEFSHFADMPKAQEEKVDLEASLRKIIGLYEDTPNLQIEREKGFQGTPYVLADPDQLERVFTNLLSNAIEALPEERKGRVKLSLEDAGGMWALNVADNGVGIPEEMREKVFEPKFSTQGRGSGLGLAMARKIVEMSGGWIAVRSSSDEGTIMRLELPKSGE